MKNNAIIRIVIYSSIAIILTAALVLGLCFGTGNLGININGMKDYDDKDYSILDGEQTFNNDTINSIDIDWDSGNIEITSSDDDYIKIVESIDTTDNEEKLRYSVQKNTLKIRYKKYSWFNWFQQSIQKDLTVMLPNKIFNEIVIDNLSSKVSISNCDTKNLTIDNTSGNFDINNVTVSNLNFDTVSGTMKMNNSKINDIDCDTTSGEITINGTISEKAKFDSTSGDINLESSVCPKTISTDTISSEVNIKLPNDSKFTTDFDSTSGDLSSEFATYPYNSTDKDFGHFEFESVSGDVNISIIEQ